MQYLGTHRICAVVATMKNTKIKGGNMNFEMILTEYEFKQIIEKVKCLDLFEVIKFDKVNKIELRIGGHHCDNGIWRDNYLCCIDGSKKHGDWHGFGSPYQTAEFLKLTYAGVAKQFACFGYELPKVKQLSIFDMI